MASRAPSPAMRARAPLLPAWAVAAVVDHSDRGEQHANDLLGDSDAIVTSDRWWAYGHLPVARRQVCWSHLQRDFAFHADGRGVEKELGEHGLRICERLFWAWEIFQHTGDRAELKRRVRALQRELKPIVREHAGTKARYRPGRRFARNLLKIWSALWTFAKHPGVEPTNNHAERALRGAVTYRKLSLASQSEGGETRIARLLSAHTHLPPATPQPARLPRRRARRPRPRRPRAAPRLKRAGTLNAYKNDLLSRRKATDCGGRGRRREVIFIVHADALVGLEVRVHAPSALSQEGPPSRPRDRRDPPARQAVGRTRVPARRRSASPRRRRPHRGPASPPFAAWSPTGKRLFCARRQPSLVR